MTQLNKIKAPFTAKQVESLNKYQKSGLHEFTCGNDHEGNRVLIATPEGWKCPTCDYVQEWAFEFMANIPIEEIKLIYNYIYKSGKELRLKNERKKQ